MLFFVSVGMLFDPAVLLDWPGRVLAIVAVIVAGKALAAFAIVAAYRYPARVGLTVAAGLSQIGEFSFILVAVGSSLGLFPAEGTNLVLAGALLSITLNPLLFAVVEPLARRLERRPESEPDAGRLVECDRDGVTAAATE